jgi:hypothetical protein
VTRHDNRNIQARKAAAPSRIPAPRLDALLEEAIVDAYTEAEQAVGFHATIEQHLGLPFETVVLGRQSPRRRSMSPRQASSS